MTILSNLSFLAAGIILGAIISSLVRYNQVTNYLHSTEKLKTVFSSIRNKSPKGSKEEARNEGILEGIEMVELFINKLKVPKLDRDINTEVEEEINE